jgi:type IV pilus assembly protein PilO
MTYSSDLIESDLVSNTSFIAPPTYPSVFGISFSPLVSGACVAVIGLGVSGYLFMSYLQPQFTKNQELAIKLTQTQEQIQQRQDNVQKIAAAEQSLKQATDRKQVVHGLFASDKKLDTLLLDLSKLVSIRQGQLQSFEPEASVAGSTGSGAVVVSDGSFGAALNNKIKRKGVRVQLQGNFEQIQSILRTIERLDQLLVIKDFRADVDFAKEKIILDSQGKVTPVSEPVIKASFKIQALIPMTPAEQAAATPPPVKK